MRTKFLVRISATFQDDGLLHRKQHRSDVEGFLLTMPVIYVGRSLQVSCKRAAKSGAVRSFRVGR